MVKTIRKALAADAVEEASNVHLDRIMCAVSLMLNETFGFGAKRIMRGLNDLNEILTGVEHVSDWADKMDLLKEKTGLVIRNGTGDRLIIECLTDDEIEERENNGSNT